MDLAPFTPHVVRLLAFACALPCEAWAQGGVLTGYVVDSAGIGVRGADVQVAALGLRTLSADSGSFRLALPAGRHTVAVRHLGFSPVAAVVTINDGGTVQHRFTMTGRLTMLDPVETVRPMSVGERRFEERRKSRQGTYITSAELRKMDERPLRSILSRYVAGVSFVNYKTGTYLASSRGGEAIDRRLRVRAIVTDGRSPTACWLQIYLDGARLYAPNGQTDAINVNEYQTRNFEAIEYYSGASTPPEFGTTWAGCGTLVLWTRLP